MRCSKCGICQVIFSFIEEEKFLSEESEMTETKRKTKGKERKENGMERLEGKRKVKEEKISSNILGSRKRAMILKFEKREFKFRFHLLAL
jgi:hypothetical protein